MSLPQRIPGPKVPHRIEGVKEMRSTGYEGGGYEWGATFHDFCVDEGVLPSFGLEVDAFKRYVNGEAVDPRNECFVSIDDLMETLQTLPAYVEEVTPPWRDEQPARPSVAQRAHTSQQRTRGRPVVRLAPRR